MQCQGNIRAAGPINGSDAQYVFKCGYLKSMCKVTIEDIPEITEVVCTELLITKSMNGFSSLKD